MTKDTGQYVLSCTWRRRKRASSRQMTMRPGRAVDPWDGVEIDLLVIGATSHSQNKYILPRVNRAPRFLFGLSLPSKQADRVARMLAGFCLTFGVPQKIRCGRSK